MLATFIIIPFMLFNVGWFIDDIRETVLAFNPSEKKQFLDEQYARLKSEIDKKVANKEIVPQDLLDRASDKKVKSDTVDVKSNPISDFIDKIRYAHERDEVKQIINDFKSGDYDRTELQERVSALDIVTEQCPKGISVAELEVDKKHAYEVIQQRCPRLQNIGGDEALRTLNE